MELVLIITIILFYISLAIELIYFSVPSVVATRKILFPSEKDLNNFSENKQIFFHWPLITKIIVFVFPMVFIYLIHLIPIYYIYIISFKNYNVTTTSYIFFIGILLVAIGRIISHMYLIKIKRIKDKSFEGFVTKGVFKFSRNPGLVALYISFLGFIIIFPSTLIIISFIIYVIHMHFKILLEEDYLTKQNGDIYKTYKNKIRRYL